MTMREKQFHVNSAEIILTQHQHRICRKRIEKDIGILYSIKEWVKQTEKFMKEMEEKHIDKIKKNITISLIMAIVSTITFFIILAIYIK